jgi:hypothetical protein
MTLSSATRGMRVRVRQQRIRHKRPSSDESTRVDLPMTPAEPELIPATRLAARGGRSERESGLSSAPGHSIEEFEPRAQKFAAAQTREALRLLDLEERAAALRPAERTPARSTPRRRKVDARKVWIAAFKAKYPTVEAGALCVCLDGDAEQQKQLRPRPEWTAATGLRTWVELWSAVTHPKIQNTVKKYIHSVRPFSAH